MEKLRKNTNNIVIYFILGFASLIVIYPFYLIVVTSLKTQQELYLDSVGGMLTSFHFENYSLVWTKAKLHLMFSNSLMITAVSLIFILLIVTLASFSLSRMQFAGKRGLYLLFFMGIFLPFQLSMIPLIKIIKGIGLFDTHLGLDLLYINSAIPFGIFLIVGFMRTIPKEIDEAAIVDGASKFRLYLLLTPLVMPAIATLAILQGVAIWNDFFIPNLFITTYEKKTITVGIMSFKGMFSANWSVLMAGVLISVTPVLLFYVAAQKYIVNGMTAGSIKG
ncbi:carbohydrate ABC transporter permease [Cohnella abietis]|nr:carbohydrate ABC transporter permease [Cohnella abietis]